MSLAQYSSEDYDTQLPLTEGAVRVEIENQDKADEQATAEGA